jgi:hypothetical protein
MSENYDYANVFFGKAGMTTEAILMGIANGHPQDEMGEPSNMTHAARNWPYEAVVVMRDGRIAYPDGGQDALTALTARLTKESNSVLGGPAAMESKRALQRVRASFAGEFAREATA